MRRLDHLMNILYRPEEHLFVYIDRRTVLDSLTPLLEIMCCRTGFMS